MDFTNSFIETTFISYMKLLLDRWTGVLQLMPKLSSLSGDRVSFEFKITLLDTWKKRNSTFLKRKKIFYCNCSKVVNKSR